MDVAVDPNAASEAARKAYADLQTLRAAGTAWSDVLASVEGQDSFYAAAMRSHVAMEQWHERLHAKRLLRLSLLLEREF